MSRYIIGCALVDNDDRCLTLSKEQQRALAEGVERLTACVEALLAPPPGSDVTLHEAPALPAPGGAITANNREASRAAAAGTGPAGSRPGQGRTMTGKGDRETDKPQSVSCTRMDWERLRECARRERMSIFRFVVERTLHRDPNGSAWQVRSLADAPAWCRARGWQSPPRLNRLRSRPSWALPARSSSGLVQRRRPCRRSGPDAANLADILHIALGAFAGTLPYIAAAVALITYVPADLIAGVVGGDGFSPTVKGALVGALAYLNGYAVPPLVAGLMEHGMSPGAAMVCELHPGHGRRVVARASASVRHLERCAVLHACRLNLTHHPRTERIPAQ